MSFQGWETPEQNWSKLPNSFFEITDLDPYERIILLYVLRHTWGYSEFGQKRKISVDEFVNGRRYSSKGDKAGKRMDAGWKMALLA